MEDGNNINVYEDNTLDVPRYTIVRHLPNKLIPNTEGGFIPYEQVEVNLEVEDMSKITMEFEKKNTVDDVINACMLQLSLNDGLKRFRKKGEEDPQKEIQQIHDMSTFKPIGTKDLS